VTDHLASWPLRPWLVADGGTISRRAMRAQVLSRARELRHSGLRPGDRVGWWPQSTALALVELLSLVECGAEPALLPLRAPHCELRDLALRLELRACLGTPAMELDLPALESGHALPAPTTPPRGRAGSVLLRSSGSLGGGCWIQHQVEALVRHARILVGALGVDPRDTWQLSLPLDHVGGLAIVLRALVSGCALALPEPGAAWHPAASWLSLVPLQLRRLLESGVRPTALRGVLMGGAPLPTTLAQQALERGWPLWSSYGATETGSAVCAAPLKASAGGGAITSGRPLWPHRLWLEQEGRISVASPCVRRTVLDELGRPVPVPSSEWRSGDTGQWRNGMLLVRGRLDRVIICGGEKIPPERVEEALQALPQVRQAVVVPTPDPRWGQRAVAFVQWEAGRECGLPELRALLSGLPRHWHPVRLFPWPAGEDGLKASPARLEALTLRLRQSTEAGDETEDAGS